MAGDVLDGEDIPGVFGDDVGDEEVDFGGFVGGDAADGAAVGVDVIEAVFLCCGGFDLDAEEFVAFGPSAADEDEVEALAVAVGLGDAEAEAGGFVDEGEFGELSATLGVEFALVGRGRARRGGASATSAGWRHSLGKRNGASGELAPQDSYSFIAMFSE